MLVGTMGLLLGAGLLHYAGLGAVAAALRTVGWGGAGAVLAFHLGLFGLLGLCWFVILPRRSGRTAAACVWGRMVRDAGSDVLPLSQLGGLIMGVRAAGLAGLPAALAFASTLVDVTLEMVAQLAFTGIGLALLTAARPDSALVGPTLVGLGFAGLATLGFIAAQLLGLELVESLVRRLAVRLLPAAPAGSASVQEGIHEVYRAPGRLALGALLHLAAWVASGIEAWLALRFMGVEVDGAAIGPGPVLAMESLLYAARSAAFAVPNAVGVQEGAYVMLGAVFGLEPETVLALSLLKRSRDVVLGVPVLLAWQAAEGARLRRRPAADALRTSAETAP
jgi:putative membrane protein